MARQLWHYQLGAPAQRLQMVHFYDSTVVYGQSKKVFKVDSI
jgi:hypothetical protein